MPDPLDAPAETVPATHHHQLVIVDGRSFAISDDAGNMGTGTHGLVHDDLRHLSAFALSVDHAELELLASSTLTPLSAVMVFSLHDRLDAAARAVLTRRRWVAGGLREDIHVHNSSTRIQRWTLRLHLAADFAHLFDVKASLAGTRCDLVPDGANWVIRATDFDAATLLCFDPPPSVFDSDSGSLIWTIELAPREELVLMITAEPEVDGAPVGLAFPVGQAPAEAIPMRRLAAWQASVPRVVSTDPRIAGAVDQALADIAALRIIDVAHTNRVVVAAGAPWFMTLFGRDSLLTSWMTLPFDPELASGVLFALAELQGTKTDPRAEEEPGKILHELRRHGGGGPFASRSRYYGTVDATLLFVMLAAEADRWGALGPAELEELTPAIDAAVEWMLRAADRRRDGFIDYARSYRDGLSNQGWKDSWDGVTFADGTVANAPIALAEVQGYAYGALHAAAELCSRLALSRTAAEYLDRAAALRASFNERFFDERGWFVIGLDHNDRPIDSLTTNPGHALWTGIADPELAEQYLDHLGDPAMWTGWGLRTLAETMGAYDPLSYHNGSVWPHDTALCAAGAARYGRWDFADRIVDGALDAAQQFDGRPPELFAGIARAEAPIPVAYTSSCSPQAWSSASVLLLMRTLLDLQPSEDGTKLLIGRPELSSVVDLRLERLVLGGRRVTIEVEQGRASVWAVR